MYIWTQGEEMPTDSMPSINYPFLPQALIYRVIISLQILNKIKMYMQ